MVGADSHIYRSLRSGIWRTMRPILEPWRFPHIPIEHRDLQRVPPNDVRQADLVARTVSQAFRPPLFHRSANARTMMSAYDHTSLWNDAHLVRKTFATITLILTHHHLIRSLAQSRTCLNFGSHRRATFAVTEERDI